MIQLRDYLSSKLELVYLYFITSLTISLTFACGEMMKFIYALATKLQTYDLMETLRAILNFNRLVGYQTTLIAPF